MAGNDPVAEDNRETSIEDIDPKTRYDLYQRAFDNDTNRMLLNASDFDKAIRYIAATLLVALFTGISFQESNPTFFKAIFILSISTIVINALAYPSAQYSLKKHMVYADFYFLRCDRSYRDKQHWTRTLSFILECLSVSLLIIVAFLFVFGFFTEKIVIKGV